MKLASQAKITNNHHQNLLSDHQVPPTYPNVAEESNDYQLQKSVEIIFSLICSHLIFLDETAVIFRPSYVMGINVLLKSIECQFEIQLLESPIPAAPAPSQKASSDDISGTKRGIIDPLVSKQKL